MEPDMQRDNGKKMYIVYRALADNMNQLPGPYYVRAALEIDASSPAEYTDTQIIGVPSILPGGEEYEPFPLRYYVVAIDKHNDYSVPSDFATAIGLKPEGSSIDPGNGDKLISENGLPKEYNLFQNYPNPFNPVTNIKFDLPKEGLVTLKVYDVLGREVKNIVNEFKQAGSYIVSFDGSELSSGIYFYRLESGNFVQVRRMVLIK
ncbi:MAG: T9SS type A sorting domain-containing protein [Ignavibacteria bacterium]|nr:T9SS type A sorting domain-containing protein [Ignavibacteria bacterium]